MGGEVPARSFAIFPTQAGNGTQFSEGVLQTPRRPVRVRKENFHEEPCG